jgi:hypothetical protein
MLVDVMKRHLTEFPAEGESLIFRGPIGAPLLRRRVFRPDFTSTIYATPAKTWRQQAAPAPAS